MQAPEESPWVAVYGHRGFAAGQYHPLLSEAEVSTKRFRFVDDVVDSAPGMIGLMLEWARPDLTGIVDSRAHLAIDRFEEPVLRIRPASYLYHVRCWRSLDVPLRLALGDSVKVNTIRRRLYDLRGKLQPDSDVFSCKLGVTGIVVARESDEILTTRRAEGLAYYPGCRHSSFSGGVELDDLGNDDALADVLRRGAHRECLEELDVDMPLSAIRPLGLWYDLERLSVQAFVRIDVETRDAFRPRLNREVAESRWELRRGPTSPKETPELTMFRAILKR